MSDWKTNDGSSSRHPEGEVAEVKLRDGRVIQAASLRRGSQDLYWRHDHLHAEGLEPSPHDIMEYR